MGKYKEGFQNSSKGDGDGGGWDWKFSWGILPDGENMRSDFDFWNLFQSFLWTPKINWNQNYMIWVFKDYEFNIKIARVQWIQLKMKFIVGYNLKNFFFWGGDGGVVRGGLTFSGGIFQVGERVGMSKFLTGGLGTPSIPSNSKKPNKNWLNRAKD